MFLFLAMIAKVPSAFIKEHVFKVYKVCVTEESMETGETTGTASSLRDVSKSQANWVIK